MLGSRSVLIAGTGTMGRGIAELVALAGFEVQLWDHQPGALGRASAAVERSLRSQLDAGRITEEKLDDTLDHIRLISDFRVLNPRTEFVIEAVREDMALKKELLRNIEGYLPRAWLVSQVASLSIGEMAGALHRPECLLGMHFFNPATVMPLVEIVYSPCTDKGWVRRAVELAEHELGKQTVVVKDSPGFLSSRLAASMALEAMRMFEQGVASIEDIDKAMECGYGHPMGPLHQSDWIGLDACLSIAEVLHRELKNEAFRPPPILRRMVEGGKLGRKSGQGFYKWLNGNLSR